MTVIVTSTNFSDLTAEEQTFAEQEKNRHLAEDQAKLAKIEQEKANQASGNQKLLDLGLTQAEATALTGYTPPSED
jgi:uncharacterized membrane protein YqiK